MKSEVGCASMIHGGIRRQSMVESGGGACIDDPRWNLEAGRASMIHGRIRRRGMHRWSTVAIRRRSVHRWSTAESRGGVCINEAGESQLYFYDGACVEEGQLCFYGRSCIDEVGEGCRSLALLPRWVMRRQGRWRSAELALLLLDQDLHRKVFRWNFEYLKE